MTDLQRIELLCSIIEQLLAAIRDEATREGLQRAYDEAMN